MSRRSHDENTFWRMVKKGKRNECWPWLGALNNGRGRIDVDGAVGVYAHRVAYYFFRQKSIPLVAKNGMHVLHKCDNAPCCNPKHLYLGTHAQNMADKKKRGRTPDFSGANGPRAKLTEDDVMMIRFLSFKGATKNALALLFDVSAVTIKGVRSGRHYGGYR